MSVLLEAKNLFCERDDHILFDGLELCIQSGELWQLAGPNGCGKTTLLRTLVGLNAHYEGDLYWRGQPRNKVKANMLEETLYLGHLSGIKAALTPAENLRWYANLNNQNSGQVDAALAQVGLQGYEDVPCFSLSAGQQRRVNLARLFLSTATLWVLDEPLTAIDKSGVEMLKQCLVNKVEQGGSVIFTTHQDLQAGIPVQKLELGA